ncbi:MAG: GntR family transcriptional regulator [Bryobacteraceae bacterium]
MAAKKKSSTPGTLADRAYEAIKRAILRGEFAEGAFLSEADITSRFQIGRTPFREACNRLHNEQLLEVVPRRGYYVPEMSFRTVRDLLETRLILEGVAAELAAKRGEPAEVTEIDRLYKQTLALARNRDDVEPFIESNTAFHLQIARMARNRELESLLRGVLERSTRLFHLVVRSSSAPEKDAEDHLRPIVAALRKGDAKAAHDAVVNDITQGQLNVLGRDLWATPTSALSRVGDRFK